MYYKVPSSVFKVADPPFLLFQIQKEIHKTKTIGPKALILFWTESLLIVNWKSLCSYYSLRSFTFARLSLSLSCLFRPLSQREWTPKEKSCVREVGLFHNLSTSPLKQTTIGWGLRRIIINWCIQWQGVQPWSRGQFMCTCKVFMGLRMPYVGLRAYFKSFTLK